MKKLLI